MTRFLPALRGGLPASSNKVAPGAALSPQIAEQLQRKVVLADYYSALLNAGVRYNDATGRPWPIERAVAEGYERVVYVWKAVETIASNSSRLKFRLREGEHVIDDHPLYRLLNHGNANPMETGRQFRKRLSAQILLSRRGSFVEIGLSNGNTPIRLDLLPPGRTRPMPGRDGVLLDHYEMRSADGRKTREIDPAKVRWIREPHPTDPYMGVTPLESAGLSIELDYFSRLYNVTFMRNDGRPGGVIGVAGDLEETEMDRIEQRFSKGPHEAGKLSVIAGELSYIDVAAKPRDMQYVQTAKNAKTEILVAFGVPESQLGNASERTFRNAGEENEAFWTITMQNHNDLIVSGFDLDSEDGLEGFLDTTEVGALQGPKHKKIEQARLDLAAGAISIDQFREIAGYDPIDLPSTRSLYLPSGRTTIPTSDADANALGIGPAMQTTDPTAGGTGDTGGSTGPAANQDPAPPTGDQPPAPDSATATPVPAAPPAGGGNRFAASREALPANVLIGPAAAGKGLVLLGGGGRTATPAPRVALRVVSAKEIVPEQVSEPSEVNRDALEAALTAVFATLMTGWADRAAVRLASPKQRKGTRHWEPEYDADTRLGHKALDANKVVDEQRWAEEAQAAAQQQIVDAAAQAAHDMADDFGWGNALVTAGLVYLAVHDDEDGADGGLRRLLTGSLTGLLGLIGRSAARMAGLLVDLISAMDAGGHSVEEITAMLREDAATHGRLWAAGLATQVATATIETARGALADALGGEPDIGEVTREWRTRGDEHVRETHRAASGQRQALDEPFHIGEALLRYPGDPLAPAREVANCRCHLRYRHRATGRMVARPTGTGGA